MFAKGRAQERDKEKRDGDGVEHEHAKPQQAREAGHLRIGAALALDANPGLARTLQVAEQHDGPVHRPVPPVPQVRRRRPPPHQLAARHPGVPRPPPRLPPPRASLPPQRLPHAPARTHKRILHLKQRR